MFLQVSVCPRGVYQSMHWAGGVSKHALGRGVSAQGVYTTPRDQRQTPPKGPEADTPPPPTDTTGYGQQAGGTHPTGMHSCFQKNSINLQSHPTSSRGIHEHDHLASSITFAIPLKQRLLSYITFPSQNDVSKRVGDAFDDVEDFPVLYACPKHRKPFLKTNSDKFEHILALFLG